MEERAIKNRCYKCIRTVYMNKDPNDIRYIEGKIYKSEEEGCITDETGEKNHLWFDGIKTTFVLVHNKRRRHENIRSNKT